MNKNAATPKKQFDHVKNRAQIITHLKSRRLGVPSVPATGLWGFLVATVISGELFGWNIAVASGWMNLFVTTVLASVLFGTLLVVINEMTRALPFSDSADILSRECLGEPFSTFQSLIVITTLQLLISQNLVVLGVFVMEFFSLPQYTSEFVWIFIAFTVFQFCKSQKLFYRAAVYLSLYSVFSILVVVFINIAAKEISKSEESIPKVKDEIPVSLEGIAMCIPASIWWYLGVECTFLVSEEIQDYTKVSPWATAFSFGTLMGLVFLIVFFGPTFGSLENISSSAEPLFDSMMTYLGIGGHSPIRTIMLFFIMVPPVFASTMGGVYASSREVYVSSRMGLLINQLSITKNGSPIFAVMFSCALAFATAVILSFMSSVGNFDSLYVTRMLMMLPAWTACISYTALCLTFVISKLKMKYLYNRVGWLSIVSCFICFLVQIIFYVALLYTDTMFYGACLIVCSGIFLLCVFFHRQQVRRAGHTESPAYYRLYLSDMLKKSKSV